MNGIEIFIDESGDFGKYAVHCPYYVVTMVFHESIDQLYNHLEELEYSLDALSLADHCIHSSPAIRGEETYFGMPLAIRRKVIRRLLSFIHNANFKFKCFFVKKSQTDDDQSIYAALKEQIDPFVTANFEKLASYSKIMVAYDKGQKQISRLITQTLEERFDNVFVTKTLPIQSRLSQVADFACTMKRIARRLEDTGSLAKPERYFFGSESHFRRFWLKSLIKREWK